MAIEESTGHISGRLLVDAESAFRYNPAPTTPISKGGKCDEKTQDAAA